VGLTDRARAHDRVREIIYQVLPGLQGFRVTEVCDPLAATKGQDGDLAILVCKAWDILWDDVEAAWPRDAGIAADRDLGR
jgi:hypothetical protein